MSGMILHLDEFGEDEGRLDLHLAASREEASHLLADSGYAAAGPLTADLEADRIGTSVRVRGPVSVEVEFECGRCLERRQQALDLDAEFVLMAKSAWAEKYEDDDERELDEDEMDVSFYEGEDIDLAPLLREAILLELPTLPRCPDDLRAQCDEAYRQNVGETALEQLEEAALDQRWAALKNFKLKD